MTVVAAVDCGATSVRVCRVDLDAPVLVPEVVHRVPHHTRADAAGHLRWDWDRITAAVDEGLERCLALGPLASIGVDTWAVDYGLLDADGVLLGPPYSYRDRRTDDYRTIVDAFGPERMYAVNGLQFQPFNTVFQLARHDRAELDRAERLLWLPELLVHHLTGVAVTEATSAGSSGLVDVTTGTWSPEMLYIAGVDASLLGGIESAGRVVGTWRGVPVSLVGGHDTASAVIGTGSRSSGGSVFVASGTWMLVGAQRERADTSSWAMAHNFSNETGALGGFRFLRNVTGFWLLEQCRQAWGGPPIDDLVTAATRATGAVPVVDVDHESLRSPEDMLGAYTRLAGLRRDADPGVVARSIVESVARAVADVVLRLLDIAPADDVMLFGGAARMDLLTTRLAALTRRPIRIGPPEAAAVGNAIVQGIAIGHDRTIADHRPSAPRPEGAP